MSVWKKCLHNNIIALYIICLLLSLLMVTPVHAVSAAKLKAVFIFNFIHFTRWPHAASIDLAEQYNVCIAGEDPKSPDFTSAVSKKINGKTINTITIVPTSSTKKISSCHVLIINTYDKKDVNRLLKTIKNKPILTIGDFEQQEMMIRFIKNADKIQFIINRQKAHESGIKFSSKILRLASQVIEGNL